MQITDQMIVAGLQAAPSLSQETIRRIIEAALNPMPALPPFPWAVETAIDGRRNPVHSVKLNASNGEQVCLWHTDDLQEVEDLKKRAQFFKLAAERMLG